MDLNSLFNTQNLLQSAAVGICVWTIRSFIELKFPSLIANKVFTGIFLPSLSLAISVAISVFMPVSQGVALATTVFQGLLCGFASSYTFSALKAFLTREAEK